MAIFTNTIANIANKDIINDTINDLSSVRQPSTISSVISSTSFQTLLTLSGSPSSPWFFVAIFTIIILVTVLGNTLVILSILTTRRLRTITNYFVLNLAITDWFVGIFVMPPAVALFIQGHWYFSWLLCDIWISLDVLLCTASILSLCVISLDRYLAVTRPLIYSRNKRTKRLALLMIITVWVMALCITCPPYLGWYEQDRHKADGYVICRYNQNKGYVIFSAMGSFFIPLMLMLYVYMRIGNVLKTRRHRIIRAANSERLVNQNRQIENLSECEWFARKFITVRCQHDLDNTCKLKNSKCCICHKQNRSRSLPNNLKLWNSFVRKSDIAERNNHVCNNPSIQRDSEIRSSLVDNRSIFDNDLNQLYKSDRNWTSGSSLATATIFESHALQTENSHNVFKVENVNHLYQQHEKHQPQQTRLCQYHYPKQQNFKQTPIRISTLKTETKTAKTLTIVMGGFIICWLPFFIYYLLMPFLPSSARVNSLMSILTWIGWVNCSINPFIYAFYNTDFRLAFWRLICRCFCN